MKDPLSRGLVLPRTRLEQAAHDGHPSGAAYAVGRLHGIGETEYSMATGDQNFDEL
jgi:hypothetical protein